MARQCARAGKHTLLVEQNDFASGVTSRSTRIIHGGLRYLEHGEFELIRESLREREKLLRERSHLVHPMHFLLLLNETSQRSAMKVRAGLWLYQRMAGNLPGEDSTGMELKRIEGALDAGRRWSFFNYEDAQCEFPERLVAEWLMEAVDAGAVVRNHMEVLAVDLAHGRARGVLLRDQITGRDARVDAGWVINCTGPWADRVCQRSAIRMAKPLLGGVRGSHIVLPRFPGSPSAAIYTEAVDGRPIFVLPWNDQILVGTTEVADNGDPAKTVPSPEEINYLIRSAAQLFPKAKISAHTREARLCRNPALALFTEESSFGGYAAAYSARPHRRWRGSHALRHRRQADDGSIAGARVRTQDWVGRCRTEYACRGSRARARSHAR